MKKSLFCIACLGVIFLSPNAIFSQTAPDLKSAASYIFYNQTGEFTCNSPSAIVIGDVGNQTGALTAFPPGFSSGNKHFHDATATQVGVDVASAYAAVAGATGCIAHTIGFGNNEILTPGVHCAGAASTLTGNIILDAANNASAVFIIKIDGAFSSVSGAQVILLNGASSCNVFWQINGEVDLVNTVFKGTMLVNGAVNLGDGTIIDGRVLATSGSLIFGAVVATICDITLVPLQLINFDVAKTSGNDVQVSWITASEVNVARYELETSINGIAFHTAGSVSSKENSFPTRYNFDDAEANKTGIRFYRLKMIDKDGSFTYSMVKSLKFSDLKFGLINIFPNPAKNTINITVNTESEGSVALNIVNMHGQKIMQKTRLVTKGLNNITEDIQGLAKGSYILNIKNIKTGLETRQNFQKL